MEFLTLDRTHQRRAIVLAQLLAGRISTEEAAASLGRSVRTVERWRPAFRQKGAAALIHGNTGRAPSNALAEEVREAVVEFARVKYAGFNFEHLAEMLEEMEGLQVSSRSVHRFCTRGGISSPRPQRRRRRHRKRRERAAREGELLQLDGSPHDWLEGRGPRLTLLTAIDDATGKRWAIFREGV